MAIYGLTDDGLLIKSFDVIKAELTLSYQAEFGDDVNVDPLTSWDGKTINIYSEREASVWQVLQAVHDSAYPDSADGINLDGASSLTGTDRLAVTFSTVPVTITGTPGSFGAAGRLFEVEGTGERFQTNVDATIGGGGTIDVVCTAQNSGAVQANAGLLNIIVTPVTGWDSILNSSDADVGSPIESDAALRLRRQQDLQNIGAAAVNAIRARLINDISGVTDAFVFENEDIDPDVNGRPPKSIHCVVLGGVDNDIAQKIFDVKSGGIETAGIGVEGTVFNIISFVDAGNGFVIVTTLLAHGFVEGAICVIAGTTYDNGYFVKVPSGSTFQIEAIFTATDTGTVQVPTSDVIEAITDDSGTTHQIEFDRASEINVWMHIQITAGTVFNQGAKQSDVVEILTAANNEDYTITINGVDYTIDSGGSATVDSIAAALIVKINDNANGWIPVTATASGPPDEFVNLQSDYNGNDYTVTTSATTPANIEVVTASHVDGSGDQAAIRDNVIDFAEGTSLIPPQQTIGLDVFLSRYFSPVNLIGDIQSISIVAASPTIPLNVPPGGGDWSNANVAISATEIANLESLRTTIEVI